MAEAHDEPIVLGFPGQGICIDVLRAALAEYERDPLVENLALAHDAANWPKVRIRERSMLQPAIFAAGVARARRLVRQATLVVGHSLGEITALAVAGAVDEYEGLQLAAARERICSTTARQHPGDMVALLGLSEHSVERIRRQVVATTRDVLDIAAVNRPEQIVLSGTTRATSEVVRLAGADGGYAVRLPIDGPYHSSLMQAAVEPLEHVLAEIDIREPAVPWMSTTDGQMHADPAEIRTCILDALVMPVRWADALTHIIQAGYSTMVNIGPGDALVRLHDRPNLRLESLDREPDPSSTGSIHQDR